MTDSVPAFLSELLAAANTVNKLTKSERARLLERAAATIRDYREAAEANGREVEIYDVDQVHELREMARLVYLFSPHEVGKMLLEAVQEIRVLRLMVGTEPRQ